MAALILVRGLPGSGKSTIAKALGGVHLEADMFFMAADGTYNWRPEALRAAHKWCQDATEEELEAGHDVVVSNTFTTIKELLPYFIIAEDHDIVPTVIVAQNQFPNIHAVPEEALERMRGRFVYDISELFNDVV